ncbi:MAG TPA: thaumarchaeosortase [Nitrososphaeraceae archaeon]|nr:thaumarchaeosortase [Nitrososphaeraceae archaeon]
MYDKKNRKDAANVTIFGFNSSFAIIVVLIAPTLFTIILYPSTFSLSWNQGRGGFLFAMAFIAAELFGIQSRIERKRLYIVIGLSMVTIGYFIALPLGLKDSIIAVAPYYKVQLVDSWEWLWDFIMMALYVGLSLGILFGKKWYKIASAGVIYLVGSAIILSLDAFFPFDSIGPLQFIVPGYLQIDQDLINFINSHVMNLGPGSPATARGNLLVLNGLHGPFALQVFWPSAGVHSMIIYTLVMLAFLLKMNIPLHRKLIYFLIGTVGTVTVNLIRIISLSLFALMITTNVNQWEEFHSVAGEIMFLPWLGIYLASVIYIESKRSHQLLSTSQSTIRSATTSANDPLHNGNNTDNSAGS